MLGTATKLKIARNIKLQGAVSGNADFDGSANIVINTTQANIAVINGSITLSNGQGNSGVIQYPEGYNKDNCIIISANLDHSGGLHTGEYGSASVIGTTQNSVGITFRCYSPEQVGSSSTIPFKIILMKIS